MRVKQAKLFFAIFILTTSLLIEVKAITLKYDRYAAVDYANEHCGTNSYNLA